MRHVTLKMFRLSKQAERGRRPSGAKQTYFWRGKILYPTLSPPLEKKRIANSLLQKRLRELESTYWQTLLRISLQIKPVGPFNFMLFDRNIKMILQKEHLWEVHFWNRSLRHGFFTQFITMSGWPSGLRRQTQEHTLRFIKWAFWSTNVGVGSNPTSDTNILLCVRSESSDIKYRTFTLSVENEDAISCVHVFGVSFVTSAARVSVIVALERLRHIKNATLIFCTRGVHSGCRKKIGFGFGSEMYRSVKKLNLHLLQSILLPSLHVAE